MNTTMLSDENMRQKRIATHPCGRLDAAQDAASLAAFLASDEADYCVGDFYAVDGGSMAI